MGSMRESRARVLAAAEASRATQVRMCGVEERKCCEDVVVERGQSVPLYRSLSVWSPLPLVAQYKRLLFAVRTLHDRAHQRTER